MYSSIQPGGQPITCVPNNRGGGVMEIKRGAGKCSENNDWGCNKWGSGWKIENINIARNSSKPGY